MTHENWPKTLDLESDGSPEYQRALIEARKPNCDMAKVKSMLDHAHENGDVLASYALATWYLLGQSGVCNMSVRKAIPLLKLAARENLPEACFDLALCYETGDGVKQSEARALELYIQAALAGDTDSFYEVGRMHFYGLGTKRNRRMADLWFDKAERLGVPFRTDESG